MAKTNRFPLAIQALFQLGFQPVGLYACYRLGLLSGHYRRQMHRMERKASGQAPISSLASIFPPPDKDAILQTLGQDGLGSLLAEADEIVNGRVRLFGADAVPLQLTLPGRLAPWPDYETGRAAIPASVYASAPAEDIKFIWEPARFGWGIVLARAFYLTGDEKYSESFWKYFQTFSASNPPFLGPNWVSAQEAALRLIAWVFTWHLLNGSPASTTSRKEALAKSIAEHAARIPPTLVYARSQTNNHLLSEAAGLFTAALCLPTHPDAPRWRKLGWKWFNRGIQKQIDSFGEYSQHSTNYHRLMLQLALWVESLLRGQNLAYPRQTRVALSRSVHWLFSMLDFDSGKTPNLGANDGAYILPLAALSLDDYRPVVQASARFFLGCQLPGGRWDEMSLWLNIPPGRRSFEPEHYLGDSLRGRHSWGCLRAVYFTSRPSHADQLHLDLWWRGLNIAQDAGSYLYNAPGDWQNALAPAWVHNTVTLDNRDQMTRASRFLYLDWAQAFSQAHIPLDETILQSISAHQDGYHRLGFRHTRTVSVHTNDRWLVEDELTNRSGLFHRKYRLHTFRLHWLLPDWEWRLETETSKAELLLKSPHGWITLRTSAPAGLAWRASLARAGELVYGTGSPAPSRGWFSPTYGVKLAALSLALEADSPGGMRFTSEFIFPEGP